MVGISEQSAGSRGPAPLLSLYREMVRGRAVEDVIVRLADERAFQGFYHPGVGQEAGPVGVCAHLRETDALFYAHRGVAYLTAKGMDPVEIIGDFLGTTAGSTRGLGAGTVHCVDPERGVYGQGGTLGSCFPLAAGVALALRMQGRDDVAVAFFGDGASARGTFLEAAVFAVAKALPVVFVCENNGFAISATTRESQGVDSIAGRARGFGLPAETVDGTDVEAVWAAAGVAIERARRGDGPSFVEAVSVRNRGHFTGDLEPYRPLDRQLADPIQIAAARLVATGAAQAELDRINADAAAEMEAALADAKAAPLPGRDRLLAGVWA